MLISEKINKARGASSITIPIPSDSDDQTLWLVIDICKDGKFEDGKYTRINMSEHPDKFEVFSNNRFERIPDLGIGTANYGDSVTFTLDTELMPDYMPGVTYYVRYKWIDEMTGTTDWYGFKFSFDMVDLRPVKTTFGNNDIIPSEKTVYGEIIVDYTEGDIQMFNLNGPATFRKENAKNISYKESLMVIFITNGHALTVINGSSSIVYTTPCMVGVVDMGQIIIMFDNEITV